MREHEIRWFKSRNSSLGFLARWGFAVAGMAGALLFVGCDSGGSRYAKAPAEAPWSQLESGEGGASDSSASERALGGMGAGQGVSDKARTSHVAEKTSFTYSRPYTHANLTLYYIHGSDTLSDGKWLTLKEAMDQKKAVVHETGSVNMLMVENLSDDEDVFIQSGDIVKGGQQDRTFGIDMILRPKSGKMDIPAFCVEQGRWTGRPGEVAGTFVSSDQSLPSTELRLAARSTAADAQATAGSNASPQSAVWQGVSREQARLSAATGQNVRSDSSPDSLQLSLENAKLQEEIRKYTRAMQPDAEDASDDRIGMAVIINGEIRSVDVYASHALFGKLLPKMSAAAATEAVADLPSNPFFEFEVVTAEEIDGFIASTADAPKVSRGVNGRVTTVQRNGQAVVQFDTPADVSGAMGGYGGGYGAVNPGVGGARSGSGASGGARGGGGGGSVHSSWMAH